MSMRTARERRQKEEREKRRENQDPNSAKYQLFPENKTNKERQASNTSNKRKSFGKHGFAEMLNGNLNLKKS